MIGSAEFPRISPSKKGTLVRFRRAARCEALIGKHRGMFVDCAALFSDLDPNKISAELLDLSRVILIAGIVRGKLKRPARGRISQHCGRLHPTWVHTSE